MKKMLVVLILVVMLLSACSNQWQPLITDEPMQEQTALWGEVIETDHVGKSELLVQIKNGTGTDKTRVIGSTVIPIDEEGASYGFHELPVIDTKGEIQSRVVYSTADGVVYGPFPAEGEYYLSVFAR